MSFFRPLRHKGETLPSHVPLGETLVRAQHHHLPAGSGERGEGTVGAGEAFVVPGRAGLVQHDG